MDCTECLANVAVCLDQTGNAGCINCMAEALNYPGSQLAQDALFYYSMNELGATLNDEANGRNLTPVNGPTLVSGVQKYGTNLVAASSQYFVEPAGSLVHPGSFTFTAWVYLEASGVGTTESVFTYLRPANPNEPTINVINDATGEYNVGISTDLTFTEWLVLMSTNTVIGQWQFLVVTWDAATFDGAAWLDGVPMTPSTDTIASWPGLSGANPIEVGATNLGNTFNGRLDEVAMFGSVLTQAQIDYLADGRTWRDGIIA